MTLQEKYECILFLSLGFHFVQLFWIELQIYLLIKFQQGDIFMWLDGIGHKA